MAVQSVIPVKVSLTVDSEGHRTYKVLYKVSVDIGDGPSTVRSAPSLPTVGSGYSLRNDNDQWAWCRPDCQVTSFGEDEGALIWTVEKTFSTKPADPSKQRCQDVPVENPLLEPPKINGTSVKRTEEGTEDRFGNRITNSAHEQIRGPQNEWDANDSQTVIEFNVAALREDVLNAFVNCVNDRPLWGYRPRCIKMSTWTFDRKYYNRCTVYYTVKLTFDKRTDTWDRDLMDEGTKCLNGAWVGDQYQIQNFSNGVRPDPANPHHFIRYKDKNGDPQKCVLNGSGLPAGITLGTPSTLVPVTAIANGALASIAQPTGNPNYPKLTVKVVDDNNSISQGLLVITGNDEHGNVVQEIIDFSDAGTLDYVTSRRYSQASYLIQSVVGATGADTIMVETITSQEESGNIHVEKYDEVNFLLLGIPITY